MARMPCQGTRLLVPGRERGRLGVARCRKCTTSRQRGSMAAIQDASDLSDDRVLDCEHAGPTVLRMMVGSQLRRLRESGGINCGSAGESIRASHSKISRMEMGRTGFKQRDLADLLTLYGVGDGAVRESLLAMAKKS